MDTPVTALAKDLIFLILQFCNEENLKKTAHALEQETRHFFDLKYFGELVLQGNWEEAEKYLSSFTAVEDNKYSTKIYFEMRKQKFLEALDRHEHAAALDILHKDLKVFEQTNKKVYLEMTQLLALDDFREHSSLASYVDSASAREITLKDLTRVIEANPLLQGKIKFPQISKSRLRRLINQSLNWQHDQCVHPHPQPNIDTLFTDHECPCPVTAQDQLSTESYLTLEPISADHNQIKILANHQGSELLQTSPFVSGDSTGFLTESLSKLAVTTVLVPLKTGVANGYLTKGETSYALESQKSNGPVADSIKLELPNISKIVEVSRCQYVLVASEAQSPIRRLVYTHSGNAILALAENGIHLLWKWVKSDANSSGEATAKHAPQLWKPKSGALMINDLPENSLDIVTPCFSLSRNDSYVVSASGKMLTLYNLLVFKKMRSEMPSPPAATCILFYPPDNNVLVIGMDDSTILVYNIRVDEVISKLKGHSKRVTGLAFSTTSNVLISSGADTQIILWDCATWEKKKSTFLEISIGWLASVKTETNVELDKDQKHFLAVHETQLALYETATLRRVKQWAIANFCTRISHATFSCDSKLVYAVMRGGILLILGASDLTPRFEIDPSAYLPPRISFYVEPIVIAAHPQKPNQFALGLSNGGVVVIEPLGYEGKWAALPPQHSNL